MGEILVRVLLAAVVVWLLADLGGFDSHLRSHLNSHSRWIWLLMNSNLPHWHSRASPPGLRDAGANVAAHERDHGHEHVAPAIGRGRQHLRVS